MVVFYEYFASERDFILKYVEEKCLEEGKTFIKGILKVQSITLLLYLNTL